MIPGSSWVARRRQARCEQPLVTRSSCVATTSASTSGSAVILGVEGPEGGPPYLVRWDEDGHESTFFPGPDTVVEHYPATRPATQPGA